MSKIRSFLPTGLCGGAAALLLAACGGADSPIAVRANPGLMLWRLSADTRAVTVAVGGTQQLSATTYLVDGSVAPAGTGTITYTSATPLKVQVTPSGLVTGLAVTSAPVSVIASIYQDGLSLVDTIPVGVTATVRPIKSFGFVRDSTRIPQGSSFAIPLKITDSSNTVLTDIAVRYTTLTPAIFTMSGASNIYTYTRGTAKLAAATTAYGVTYTDTIDLTVTNPMLVYVYCYNKATSLRDFSATTYVVGEGGTLNISNSTGAVLNLTFSDPSAFGDPAAPTSTVNAGNIVNAAASATSPRKALRAGTYTVTNVATGGQATIYVLPPA